MIKTISENQEEIIRSIIELHAPAGIQCDVTFGNGSFYKNIRRPELCFDIQPLADFVIQADSAHIPKPENTIQSIMFDPPFLTYIRAGREHNSIMGKRFSGYWTYGELEEHYKSTLRDVSRVLVLGGKMIFKCQDIIHNHRMHCTHFNVILWAKEYGLELCDMFVLCARNRIPIRAAKHGNQSQKHARIYHSYFLVFEKKKVKTKDARSDTKETGEHLTTATVKNSESKVVD
jgi:hypothetical protein